MGGNGPPFPPKFLKKFGGNFWTAMNQVSTRPWEDCVDTQWIEGLSSSLVVLYSADFALLKHSKASLKLCPATLRATDGPATPGPMLQLE